MKKATLLEYGVYINGQWEQTGEDVIEVTNPATGEWVGKVPAAGRDTVGIVQ